MIACFEVEKWQQEALQQALGDDVQFFEDALKPEHVSQIQGAEGLIVFVYSHVTREIINQLPNLKFICTMSTGFDHIDIVACHEKNICVQNVPFYGENTVAEHTMALILSLSRNIIPSVNRVKGGSFDAAGLQGFDLKGKTLGIIGTGHIGQHVIKMAHGFQMRILGYDPYPKWELQEQLGFEYMGLDDLLAQSDIITLHCPYNDSTHHLLNGENLPRVKQGAIIINTARGALIDSAALLEALQAGTVSAAGLDVLEDETHIKDEAQVLSHEYRKTVDLHALVIDHVLIHLPNVLITPHNAFNSHEALQRILDTTIENVQSAKSGEPQNLVSHH